MSKFTNVNRKVYAVHQTGGKGDGPALAIFDNQDIANIFLSGMRAAGGCAQCEEFILNDVEKHL